MRRTPRNLSAVDNPSLGYLNLRRTNASTRPRTAVTVRHYVANAVPAVLHIIDVVAGLALKGV